MALLSVDDARASVLKEARPLPAENVPLGQAHGRVLAAELVARRTAAPTPATASVPAVERTEVVS